MEQEAERRRQPQIKQEPESEEEEEDKAEKEEKREEPEEEEEEPEQKPCLKPTLRPISSAPSVSSASGNATPNTPGDESPCGIIIPHENSPEQQQLEEHRPKIGLSLKLGKFKFYFSLPYGIKIKIVKLVATWFCKYVEWFDVFILSSCYPDAVLELTSPEDTFYRTLFIQNLEAKKGGKVRHVQGLIFVGIF